MFHRFDLNSIDVSSIRVAPEIGRGVERSLPRIVSHIEPLELEDELQRILHCRGVQLPRGNHVQHSNQHIFGLRGGSHRGREEARGRKERRRGGEDGEVVREGGGGATRKKCDSGEEKKGRGGRVYDFPLPLDLPAPSPAFTSNVPSVATSRIFSASASL